MDSRHLYEDVVSVDKSVHQLMLPWHKEASPLAGRLLRTSSSTDGRIFATASTNPCLDDIVGRSLQVFFEERIVRLRCVTHRTPFRFRFLPTILYRPYERSVNE